MGFRKRFSRQHNEMHKHMMEKEWKKASLQLQLHPHHAREWMEFSILDESDGETTVALPLHHALVHEAPMEFIIALVHAYPKSLRKCDTKFRRCPLHYACWKTPIPYLVSFLLGQEPKAASMLDAFRRVPLHYAIFANAEYKVIHELLVANPDGASQEDYMKWLPLHVAVRCNCSPDIINDLIHYNPDALRSTTLRGNMRPADIVSKFSVTLDKNNTIMLWDAEKEKRNAFSVF